MSLGKIIEKNLLATMKMLNEIKNVPVHHNV